MVLPASSCQLAAQPARQSGSGAKQPGSQIYQPRAESTHTGPHVLEQRARAPIRCAQRTGVYRNRPRPNPTLTCQRGGARPAMLACMTFFAPNRLHIHKAFSPMPTTAMGCDLRGNAPSTTAPPSSTTIADLTPRSFKYSRWPVRSARSPPRRLRRKVHVSSGAPAKAIKARRQPFGLPVARQ